MKVCTLYNQGGSMGITVPAAYRRALGWKPGELLYVELTKDRTLIVRSLNENLKLKRKTARRGAGDVTQVNKRLRLPRS